MRTRLLLAVFVVMTFLSCRKETSIEGPGETAGTFMATIDGGQWIAVDTLKSVTIIGGLINLTGISADNQQLSITLNDTIPGTYRLNQLSTSIAALQNNDSSSLYAYTTNQGADSLQAGGTVTIINIDPVGQTITGTFAFNLFRDVDGKQKVVTDGIFYKLPYTTSLPGASSGDTMTADIDGQHWVGRSILSSNLSGTLVINGSYTNGTQSVTLLMPSAVTAGGPYTLDYTGLLYYGFYSPQVTGGYASSSGHLTIIQNNLVTKRIKGKFDFFADDPTGQSTQTHSVTNGYFSVQYQ